MAGLPLIHQVIAIKNERHAGLVEDVEGFHLADDEPIEVIDANTTRLQH